MLYQFKYDEIKDCYDCPLFYDYNYCEIDMYWPEHKLSSFTDSDDGKRPDWCPLTEVADNA